MSGPVGPTRGARFTGGYQFPRTHSARLKRGAPIRVEQLGDGAIALVVPLTGGRLRQFDVCGQWRSRGPDGRARFVSSTAIARDELEATALFVQLVKTIRREKDGHVDAIA